MNDMFDKAYWELIDPDAFPVTPGTYFDQVVDPLTGRSLVYDRKGRPISMREWGRRLEDDSWKAVKRSKQVRQDFVGRYRVSTVWLGLDHSHGLGGPPLIFETMVFERRRARGIFGLYHPDVFDIQWRYATEEEALRGHYAVRKLVRLAMHALNGPRPLPVRVRRGLALA